MTKTRTMMYSFPVFEVARKAAFIKASLVRAVQPCKVDPIWAGVFLHHLYSSIERWNITCQAFHNELPGYNFVRSVRETSSFTLAVLHSGQRPFTIKWDTRRQEHYNQVSFSWDYWKQVITNFMAWFLRTRVLSGV